MLIDSLKMPSMLTTFGIFFVILTIMLVINTLLKGYCNGIMSYLFHIIGKNKIFALIYIIVVVLIIFFLDSRISLWCKNNYNVNWYTLLDFFCSMGESWFIVGIFITIMLIARLLNANYVIKVCELSFSVAIYSGIVNGILKFIFNRERPFVGYNPLHFFRFLTSIKYNLTDLTYTYNSMPSGHTITIASSLTLVFLSFKNKFIKLMCLFFMLVIPMARVYTLNHWFSDVFVSFILGSLFGYIVYKIHVNNI